MQKEQEARIQELEPALKAAYPAFQQSLDGIKASFSELSVERREALTQRQLLQSKDDRGLVRDLGDGVALLHTLILSDRVHLLLTLPEVLFSRQSAVGEAEINKLVQHLRQALRDPLRCPHPAAAIAIHFSEPPSS